VISKQKDYQFCQINSSQYKHGGQACNQNAILLKEVNIFKIGMQKRKKKT
jgi:hypothetical protein